MTTVDLQVENIEKIKIKESFRKSRILSSLISQFQLKKDRNISTEQKIIERLIEYAIEIRGIMVTMIQSREIDIIQSMVKEKIKLFQDAWNFFGEIRNINTELMLEGKYEEALENLVQRGQVRFKKSLDVLVDWLQELEE